MHLFFTINCVIDGIWSKNLQPPSGSHCGKDEYCFACNNIEPLILFFLIKNTWLKLILFNWANIFTFPSPPYTMYLLKLYISDISVKCITFGRGVYASQMTSNNFGNVNASYRDNYLENVLNIWSMWSCVWPTRRKLTFTFLNTPYFTNILKYPKIVEFLFSLVVLSNWTYRIGGNGFPQFNRTLWITITVRLGSLWTLG